MGTEEYINSIENSNKKLENECKEKQSRVIELETAINREIRHLEVEDDISDNQKITLYNLRKALSR